MRKKLPMIFLALLVIIGSYCLYQEAHFGTTAFVPANMSEAQLLEELPDIAISEQDKALRQAVLDLPQVQSGLRNTSPGHRPDFRSIAFSSVQSQLEPHLPEGWTDVMELTATRGNVVYLTLSCGMEKSIYYQFSTDDNYQICKTIGIYRMKHNGERKSTVIYSNYNNAIQKLVEKRIWFDWLNRDK